MGSRPCETRSLPSSLAATHRGFTFHVGLPIYVARVPAAPFARLPAYSLLPSSLYLDHSHGLRARASFPSCVTVYPRDARSRRVLCR